MDPNQQKKPAAKQSDGEPLIKARVRPNNKYGGAMAGDVVEVTARELKRVSHALISLDDEARNKTEAAKPQPLNDGQKMFRMFRASAREAQAVKRASRAASKRAELESLGLTVTGGKAAG